MVMTLQLQHHDHANNPVCEVGKREAENEGRKGKKIAFSFGFLITSLYFCIRNSLKNLISMFSEALKQLIEASLVDGVLRPEERAILLKRAMLEGIDADEANLLIDAEVQKLKLQKQAKAPKVHKCPYCGEILSAKTVTCPSCGNVIDNGESEDLNSLVDKMTRSLAQMRSCVGITPMMITSLEELRQRALALYPNDQTVERLAEDIDQEIKFYRQEEAELRKIEALKSATATRPSNSGGGSRGGGDDSLISKKGCRLGCLIAFIAFIVLCVVAVNSANDDDEKADRQYQELVSRLDSLKADPLTVENYAAKEAVFMDLIWVENNEYSTHEKNKKEAFTKLLDNYLNQLSTFYALNHEAIDDYNGYTLHDLSDVGKGDSVVTTE